MLGVNIEPDDYVPSQFSSLQTMFPTDLSEESTAEVRKYLNMSEYYNFSFSASEYGFSELWMRHSPEITTVFCIAYSIVFVLGILGNSLVVSVVVRSPRMRTVTNYFIVNLAMADILVVFFCLPATLLSNIFVRSNYIAKFWNLVIFLPPIQDHVTHFRYTLPHHNFRTAAWMLGWFMCKTVSYLQGVSVSASINTLVAISVDRFLAICYPLKCQMTPRNARRIIVIIWVFSLLITLPWALYFRLIPIDPATPDITICMELWPHEQSETTYFLAANLGLCYLLPLSIISMCYIGIWIKVCRRHIPGETKGTNADVVMQRSKLKVVKMMVIVVVLFVLSWLPLYVIFTMVKLGGPVEEDSEKEKILMVLAPIAQWLGASNSCINPVLYTFFNKKFRKGFLAIIKSRSCCGTLRYEAANKGTRSTVLRSTFKSRDTQCEYVNTAQV